MLETINWLHLSDLHLGLDDQNWVWPSVRSAFLKDLERLTTEIGGGWDIVFFTGDLTQKGGKQEFDKLNRELEAIWKTLSRLSAPPVLCVIPGNHDLQRPDKNSLFANALRYAWQNDREARNAFWSGSNENELRRSVRDSFENYSEWVSSAAVPIIQSTQGLLPGDFSATFIKGEAKLGIVGLNSTFLQIGNDVAEGKLALHVAQIAGVCDDPQSWFDNHNASALLTHQPPSWLSPESLESFKNDIAPPGRFFTHLCGHLHEPNALDTIEFGAQARRLRQAPSLFGLQYWGDTNPKQRIHGYYAGQFIFDGASGIEKLWPRTSIPSKAGGINVAPDYSFTLTEGFMATSFDTNSADESGEVDNASFSALPASEPVSKVELLEDSLSEEEAKKSLSLAPQLSLESVPPHHKVIRLDEQSQLENELRKDRIAWIVADWGAGKEGFLSALVERFRTALPAPTVFHFRCDEISKYESIEAYFLQQFGISLQVFCNLARFVPKTFLIFDDLHPLLCQADVISKVNQLGTAIRDYCDTIFVIFFSRVVPASIEINAVELKPLEEPDVRSYLANHPDATSELRNPETIAKLHEVSEGLPSHLDRMIQALKVSSLASVLETEIEGSTSPAAFSEPISSALSHTVSTLALSSDKQNQRSFRLLKVLSIVPYGETIESLRHFLPTEPFHYEHALKLNKLVLLEVVTLQQIAPHVESLANHGADSQAPKLLKVPRQVRDYVVTLVSDEERSEIVAAGLEHYFGRSWRSGKVKLRPVRPEYREYLSSGAGNEFALLHHFISSAKEEGRAAEVKKGAKLSLHYAAQLRSQDRYRDLAAVCGSLIHLINLTRHLTNGRNLHSVTELLLG